MRGSSVEGHRLCCRLNWAAACRDELPAHGGPQQTTPRPAPAQTPVARSTARAMCPIRYRCISAGPKSPRVWRRRCSRQDHVASAVASRSGAVEMPGGPPCARPAINSSRSDLCSHQTQALQTCTQPPTCISLPLPSSLRPCPLAWPARTTARARATAPRGVSTPSPARPASSTLAPPPTAPASASAPPTRRRTSSMTRSCGIRTSSARQRPPTARR
jgi:hypothetical protein